MLLSIPVAVVSQERKAREVHLGALGGAVMSNYNFSPKVTQDMALGYTAGLAVRYIEEEIFGLQVEFLMTKRGIKDHFDPEQYPSLSYQRSLIYLEMPIMAHVYFNIGEKSEIAVDLGPKLGYYLSSSSESQLDGPEWIQAQNSVYHGYKHHDLEVTKRFDYGLQAGLGYEFKINKEISVQLQGRYYFGLGNMFPDKKSDAFENSNNNQIQIVAAVWFRQQIAKYLIKSKQRKYRKK